MFEGIHVFFIVPIVIKYLPNTTIKSKGKKLT